MKIIRTITALETYPVRHEVLRKGRALESCHFDGDDLLTTVHFGLYENEELAAILTILESRNPAFKSDLQFQLRGMAVRESHQKKGYGEELLRTTEEYLKNQHGKLIWFNARVSAVGFYEKCGYKKSGPLFEIENVGPHYLMYKEIL